MSENHSKLPYNLITAAYQGDVKTAIAQLAEGADVNARDCDGDERQRTDEHPLEGMGECGVHSRYDRRSELMCRAWRRKWRGR